MLQYSVKDCYKKFLDSEANIKVSYNIFCRQRPFWVVPPTLRNRETCGCIKHENFKFILERLSHLKIINTQNTDDLLQGNFEINLNTDCKADDTYFFKWARSSEIRIIKGVQKTVTLMKKEIINTKQEGLVDLFYKELPSFILHIKAMRHQYDALKFAKENLKCNEIIFQIDFSENYISKCHREIQSMHFGASKKQVSIHTGVYYFINDNETLQSKCFATMSNNLDHQSHAIWSHMQPILSEVASKDTIQKIHFFSDGPSAQYKNRFNLYLAIDIIKKEFPAIKVLTWNYMASGHGKGPMDGVGGTLKRTADFHVARGSDITCARDFCEISKVANITTHEIEETCIESMKHQIPKNDIPKIKGIFKMHQAVWNKENCQNLYLRELSCFDCQFVCRHFPIGEGQMKFCEGIDKGNFLYDFVLKKLMVIDVLHFSTALYST